MAGKEETVQVTEATSNQNMRFMAFTWNADGVRICRTLAQTVEEERRQETVRGVTTHRYTCATPDFFRDFINQVEQVKPHLVVVATQGEPSDGTYLHSDFLPARMPEHGYRLLNRGKLDKVGLGSSGLVVNGMKVDTSDRLSVYVAEAEAANFRAQDAILDSLFGKNHTLSFSCHSAVSRAAGAIAVYVNHPVFGRFCFISLDLPESSDILSVRGGQLDYDSYRTAIRAANVLCLINMQNHFYFALPEGERAEHIVVLGDFNYEIRIPGKTAEEVAGELASKPTNDFLRQVIEKYDEFTAARRDGSFTAYKEGPSNDGPLFPPTYWLHRDRSLECQRGAIGVTGEGSSSGEGRKLTAGCYEVESHHFPAWRERIIYKDMGNTNFVTHCTYYQSIDTGNMKGSRHAGVVGIFVVKKNQ